MPRLAPVTTATWPSRAPAIETPSHRPLVIVRERERRPPHRRPSTLPPPRQLVERGQRLSAPNLLQSRDSRVLNRRGGAGVSGNERCPLPSPERRLTIPFVVSLSNHERGHETI